MAEQCSRAERQQRSPSRVDQVHVVDRREAKPRNERERTRLLGAYNATVVDGPGRGGLYNIRFNGIDKGDVGKTVQRLQAETRIVEFIASKE